MHQHARCLARMPRWPEPGRLASAPKNETYFAKMASSRLFHPLCASFSVSLRKGRDAHMGARAGRESGARMRTAKGGVQYEAVIAPPARARTERVRSYTLFATSPPRPCTISHTLQAPSNVPPPPPLPRVWLHVQSSNNADFCPASTCASTRLPLATM